MDELGTSDTPFDASRSGPMCLQAGIDPELVANVTVLVMDDLITDVIQTVVDVPDIVSDDNSINSIQFRLCFKDGLPQLID